MQLFGEALDGINQSRRRSIHFAAHERNVALLYRAEVAPDWTRAQVGKLWNLVAMVARKNQIIWLRVNDGFKTDVRPVLRRFHNRFRAGAPKRIGDKRVWPDRDQGIIPDHKKNTAMWLSRERRLYRGQSRLQACDEFVALLRDAENSGEMLDASEQTIDGVRIGSVNGYAEVFERVNGLAAIDRGRCENEIWLESDDRFEAWAGRRANMRLRARLSGHVAIIRVAGKSRFRAECVNRLREIRRERNNAAHIGGHGDTAARFVHNDSRIA